MKTHKAKKKSKKSEMLQNFSIILILLLLVTSVGGISAYFVSKTNTIENVFTPGIVACAVSETFDGVTKSNVSISNTGNVNAYIRAYIVATWVNNDGAIYGAAAPKAGEDYTIVLGTSWVEGEDGYYYCQSAVSPGETTPILIHSCTEVEGQAPEGYSLSVEIIASAVQANPNKTYEVWGVQIS